VDLEVYAYAEAKIRLQQSRPDLSAPVEFNERFGFQQIEDVQLNAAEEVLAGVLAAKGAQK
jgi:carboxyl-terminal processing protease